MDSEDIVDEHEEHRARATQAYAALSISAVFLLVGVPVWWKTTEIYRVPLPYNDLSALADVKIASAIHYNVIVFFPQSDTRHATLMEKLTHFDSDAGAERLMFHYTGAVSLGSDDERELLETATSVEEADLQLKLTRPFDGNYTFYVLPERCKLPLKSTLSTSQLVFIANDDQDAASLVRQIEHILRDVMVNEDAVQRIFHTAVGKSNRMADKDSMRALRTTPGYQVTFTLINSRPDSLSVHWDVQSAVAQYLQSFLTTLRQFTDISVKSQCLYFISLGVQTRKLSSGVHRLDVEQLPHVINPIESYLASHVSTFPHINFVVYVPSVDQSPLIIHDAAGNPSATNAFLSPRWGGLLVYNVNTSSTDTHQRHDAFDVDMRHVMSIFTSQLRLLLGIHSMSEKLAGFERLSPTQKIISDWELDGWLRERTIENIVTSAMTLHSLGELLGKIGNIVINDDIGDQVVIAVQSIHDSRQLLANGQLREAYAISKLAHSASEKAFFDPSLLELLYFPEDQKFAIYIPLFLPVGFPMLLSLVAALRWFRSSRHPTDKSKTE